MSRFANQKGLHFGPHGMYPMAPKGPSVVSREFGGTGSRRTGGPSAGVTIVPAKTEADVFAYLGLRYMPPEMRRDKNDVMLIDGTPAFPDRGRPLAGPPAMLALKGPAA
jgi:hypothetical protein